MASFVDQIQQFSPFIKQLPTDEYLRAELYKQQKYDTGVQAVQSHLDAVTGLEVPEKYKGYLQQAASSLQEQVQKVAGADFSNMQLVNQIGGATSKIIGDKIVQTGIQSAASWKAIQSQAKKADDDGKGSTQNTWDINDAYSKWNTNPDLSKPFNYSYTPYRDVKKKILDVIKIKVGEPNGNISDDAFDINDKGEIVGVKGAILRTKLEQIGPDIMKSAIYASLDPSDLKQLEIDGRYSYGGVAPEAMPEYISNSLKGQQESIQSKLKEAQSNLALTNNAQEQNKYKGQIKDLNNYLNDVTKTYTGYAEIAKTNPDQAKAQMYTDNTLNQFGNAFSFTKLSQTYETSPAKTIQIEEQKMKDNNTHWLADYGIKQTELDIKKAELNIKLREEERKKNGPGEDGTGGFGGVADVINQSELPNVNVAKYSDIIKTDQEALDKADGQFLKDHPNISAEDLSKAREKYDQNDGSLPYTFKDHFATTDNLRKKVQDGNRMLADVKAKADVKYGKIEDLIPKDARNETFTVDGKQYTFTPAEIVNFNTKYNQLVTNKNSFDKPSSYLKNGELKSSTTDGLSEREMVLYNIKTRSSAAIHSNIPSKIIANQSILPANDVLNHYNETVNKKYDDIISKKNEDMNQQLANRTGESQRVYQAIDASDKAGKYNIQRVINDLKTRAYAQGDFPEAGTSVKKVSAALEDPEATYSLGIKPKTQFSEAQYTIKISSPKNGKDGDQVVHITPEEKMQIFGSSNEGDPLLSSIHQKMLNTGNGSTNFDYSSKDVNKEYAGANFTKTSFPNVRHYAVRADAIQQNGGYILKLYVTDPADEHKTIIPIEYSNNRDGLMSEKGLSAALKEGAINDLAIFNLLYHRDPTPEEAKQLAK